MDYEEQQHVLSLLVKARQYIQEAHDNAESLHDSYGEFYMDGGQYEVMQETSSLLDELDKAIASHYAVAD